MADSNEYDGLVSKAQGRDRFTGSKLMDDKTRRNAPTASPNPNQSYMSERRSEITKRKNAQPDPKLKNLAMALKKRKAEKMGGM